MHKLPYMDDTIFYTGNDGLTGALLDGYRAITEAVDPAGLDADLDKIGRTLRMPHNIDRVYRTILLRRQAIWFDPKCSGPLAGVQFNLYVSDGVGEVAYFPEGSPAAIRRGYPYISVPVDIFISPREDSLRTSTFDSREIQPLYLNTGKQPITGKPIPALHMDGDVAKRLWDRSWDFPGLNHNGKPCLRTAIKDAVLGTETGKSA